LQTNTAADLTFIPSTKSLGEFESAWAWLIGSQWEPVLFSVLGDAFIKLESGSIWWVNTSIGCIEQVADCLEEFMNLITTERQFEWFLPGLINVLRAQGKILKPNECYSFITFPVFAHGHFNAENIVVEDSCIHFRVSGRIHEQICGVAEGSTVTLHIPLST
jgi:hypothetical protein